MLSLSGEINKSMEDFWDLKPQAIFESVQVQPAI
jgi:hypothetical protein